MWVCDRERASEHESAKGDPALHKKETWFDKSELVL